MSTKDRHLTPRCFNGDAPFDRIVAAYKASIYALAYRRLGNFHDAEDITQEVFLKAYLKLSTLKQRDKLRPWLYAIASNLCKDFLRSKSHRLDSDYLADEKKADLDNLSMCSYHECEVCDSLHETLDGLPEGPRQVLTLHYINGMSCREIAQVFGTSSHAIDMRLTRARTELRLGGV